MSFTEFRRSGHWPTLLAAFVYFDISFCIWYLLGPLGNFIAITGVSGSGICFTQTMIFTRLFGLLRVTRTVSLERVRERSMGRWG